MRWRSSVFLQAFPSFHEVVPWSLGWLCAVLGHAGAVCMSGLQGLLPFGTELTLLAKLPFGESECATFSS